jgi:hypothetical protein
MKCDLEIPVKKLKLTGIRLHRAPGVQKGSVVLIRKRRSSEKGGQDGWLLADIFPDGYMPLTLPHVSEPSHSSQELYVNLDGDLMYLVFPDNGRWQAVRVYRFSPRLFSEGRRFIADLIVQEPVPDGCARGGGIKLDAVTRSGDRIHLHPKDSSSLFGDCTGLCLCPIMLGGRKRYLFYADEIIRLPEAV